MKYLHRINIVLFILNGFLFITIIYGFLFLMVTGAFQILINLYLYYNYKKLSIEIQKKLNYHSLLSVILLAIMIMSKYSPNFSWMSQLIIGSVSLSIPLGIYHFHITSIIKKDEL